MNDLQLCGHPVEAIHQDKEGTTYCEVCAIQGILDGELLTEYTKEVTLSMDEYVVLFPFLGWLAERIWRAAKENGRLDNNLVLMAGHGKS